MIDATNGGALMDKTMVAVRHLISNMATITNKAVNEVGTIDNLRMENQLTELTSLVRILVVSQHQQIPQVKVETNTTDNHTKLGSSMVNNLEGRSSIGRVRVKGNMQSQDLDPRQTCRP
ncbi:hypothetical protein CR513_07901, partial [Mucuna pruriens]